MSYATLAHGIVAIVELRSLKDVPRVYAETNIARVTAFTVWQSPVRQKKRNPVSGCRFQVEAELSIASLFEDCCLP